MSNTILSQQVVVDETLSATTGPHKNAPGILQQLPPYSVTAAVRTRESTCMHHSTRMSLKESPRFAMKDISLPSPLLGLQFSHFPIPAASC